MLHVFQIFFPDKALYDRKVVLSNIAMQTPLLRYLEWTTIPLLPLPSHLKWVLHYIIYFNVFTRLYITCNGFQNINHLHIISTIAIDSTFILQTHILVLRLFWTIVVQSIVLSVWAVNVALESYLDVQTFHTKLG